MRFTQINPFFNYIIAYTKQFWRATKSAVYDEITYHFGYQAAALSFYTIISIIPLLIVITTILSYFPFASPEIVRDIYRIVPQLPFHVEPFLYSISELLSKQRYLYAVMSFLMSYYFASQLFLAIHTTLQLIFNTPLTPKRRIIIQIISIPFFILGLLVIYFAGTLVAYSVQHIQSIPIISSIVPNVIWQLVMNIANLVTFLTFFLLLLIVYHFLAPRPHRCFLHSVYTALIIGLVATLLKSGFANAIRLLAAINPIYGSFGGIFSFFAWVFLLYTVMLIGARVIYHLEISRQG